METILFAVLAGYLFFRLWSVLGTRTGEEKPMDPSKNVLFERQEQDNVIVIPKQFSQASIQEEKEPSFGKQLKELSKAFTEFNLVTFKEGAEKAFILIIKAYSQGNEKVLKSLLRPETYQQFSQAIKERTEKQLRQETEVTSVQTEIISIETDELNAEITIRFKSEQLIVTYGDNGEIIDNPARLKTLLNDIWTFQRPLKSSSPTWLLVRTSADN